MKTKASRNKTIDFKLEEAQAYLDKCIMQDELRKLKKFEDLIVCGDSFQSLKLLPNSVADLVIADPPYNLRKSFHGTVFSKKKNEEYELYTRKWLEAIESVLKPEGSLYVCCDWQSSILIAPILQERFLIRNRITWQRDKGRGAVRNFKNNMEDIWYCTKSETFTFHVEDVKLRRKVIAPYRIDGKPKDWIDDKNGKFRDTHPSNFWDDITIPFWSMAENTAHPTQKPEKLIAKIILASSNDGDLVLDPFLGSGTTAVTARKLNRKFIGIEQNPLYCAWAVKRLQMAEENKEIQGYFDGVFWERNSLH